MKTIQTIILNAIKKTPELNIDQNIDISIIPIQKSIEGHYCSNIFHKIKTNKETQKRLFEEIQKHEFIKKITILNGFINISLTEEYFMHSIKNILNSELIPNIGNKTPINVEYCSVNPTGSLHIGHARNAILGDAIATLLSKVNYNVTKEYYVNDGGNQIRLLAESIYSRYCELNNITNTFPENGYAGEEIYEIAKILPNNLSITEIEKFAVDFFLNKIKKDLQSLNIKHDQWINESDIIKNNYIQKAIKIFEKNDYLRYGTLENKKVQKGEISKKNLLILKTSLFGDDQDRSLTKADGTWTYFAPDIGYHLNKIERGFKKIICVLGADHDSYAKRMQIAVNLLDKEANYTACICQLVTFKNLENDEIVKFSKRKGNSIRISDFTKFISKDIIRFMMLEKSANTQFVFDSISAKEISNKNPVFYCQYAHARACSIEKNANIENNTILSSIIFKNEDIQDLIITLEQFTNIIIEATENLAPYKIINYLKKISEKMHKAWQIGKIDNTLRFIIENNKEETQTRIQIIKAFKKVSKQCFELLGINALEKMEQQF